MSLGRRFSCFVGVLYIQHPSQPSEGRWVLSYFAFNNTQPTIYLQQFVLQIEVLQTLDVDYSLYYHFATHLDLIIQLLYCVYVVRYNKMKSTNQYLIRFGGIVYRLKIILSIPYYIISQDHNKVIISLHKQGNILVLFLHQEKVHNL